MAQKYNVDVNKIRKANNVGSGGIFIGTGSGNRESLYAVRGTGNSAVCIYDKVLYELVMTNLTNIEPNGGTYTASSYATTNKKTHGNGAVETGLALNASSVTIPANTSTAETKSGSVTVTQYDSDLASYNGASVSWTWAQIKDYPTAIELTISPKVTIPASGGSVSTALTNFNYSVKCTFKSGNVVNNFNGATITANVAQVTAQTKGTTTSQATAAGNITFTATYTCNGKTVTNSKQVTIMQDANSIASYANPTFTLSPGSTYVIPASGGSVTGGVSNVSQTRTYSSKSTDTITLTANASTNGYTVAWTGQTQTAQSKGSTTSNATSVGTITAKVTSTNGGNTTQTCTVTQEANAVTATAWDNPTFTLSPGDTVLPASGGSVTGSVSGAKQKYTYTYTSKATSTGETTSGLSTAWTGQTQTANSRGTTAGSVQTIGTTSAKVTGNGSKSTTKSYTVTQQANAITGYGNPYGITASCADIPASGGTVTATTNTTTASQRVDYTSKASTTTTGTASISWSPRQTASASSLGTTVKARTSAVTLTATYTLNGKSSAANVTVYQAANAITSTTWEDPTFTLSPGNTVLPASGGSVTGSVSGAKQKYTNTYTSKATASAETTTGLTTAWSSQTLTAATRGTTTGDVKTIGTTYAKVTGSGSKSTTKSYAVTQQANAVVSTAWGTITGNPTGSCPDIPASGGTVTGTVSSPQTLAQNYTTTYTSKATSDSSSNVSCTVAFVGGSTATAGSLGTTVKSRASAATLTIRATGNGGITKDAKITVYQEANSVTSYGNPYGITASCADIPASGGTVTASVNTTTASQQVNYKSKASATTTGTATISWSPSQTATAGSLGTTVKGRTSAATLTATYTLNGKSNTTSVTVYQQANSASYDAPYGITASCADIPASGGTVTATTNTTTASQKINYTSKASATTTGTASITWSTGQTATAGSLARTTKNRTSAVTLTATYTLNGKSSQAKVTVYQEANVESTVWEEWVNSPTGSCPTIPASGGTVTATTTSPQTLQKKRWHGFTSKDNYTETVNLSCNVAYVNGNTATANSRGTTTGTSVLVKSLTLRATSTQYSSLYTEASVPAYQEANSVSRSYGNPVPKLSTPGTIASGGGSATVTVTACTQSYTDTYTSKSTTTGSISTVSSFSQSWTRSNTAFTLSQTTGTATTVSVSANNSTSQRSTTVTVSSTANGKSGSASTTVTQAGKSALLTPRVISITASVVNNNPPTPKYAVQIIADTEEMTRNIDVALGSSSSPSSIYASNNHPTGVVEGSFYESYESSNPTVYLFVKLSDGESNVQMRTTSANSGFNKPAFTATSGTWTLVGSETLSLNLSDVTLITVTYQTAT